jgi:cell wall assembly regulator SMI1
VDWIEQLKIVAHDPYRAIPSYVQNSARDENGERYLPTANPPATLEEIQEFESKANVTLPEDLRRVYLEVGNGGFGPAYGIRKLICTAEEVNAYREKRILEATQAAETFIQMGFKASDDPWMKCIIDWDERTIESSVNQYIFQTEILAGYVYRKNHPEVDYSRIWPNWILPFCDGGCDLLGVIDLRNGSVGFVQCEICEEEPLENIVEWRSPSVSSWFESWLNNDDLMYYSEAFRENVLTPIFEKHHGVSKRIP